ncbi:hypothetical protein ASZ78_000839 [Callipepla squamata]|uniref:Uncharacterized protein n=1 Tax=Callipepla squamata TaxID=9009 RepID=A0A226MPS7_CALSU|nr:hypothetical protein ASZ78_000839 [Callipepla squamata]
MQNEIIKPAKYFSEVEKSVLLALVEKYRYSPPEEDSEYQPDASSQVNFLPLMSLKKGQRSTLAQTKYLGKQGTSAVYLAILTASQVSSQKHFRTEQYIAKHLPTKYILGFDDNGN